MTINNSIVEKNLLLTPVKNKYKLLTPVKKIYYLHKGFSIQVAFLMYRPVMRLFKRTSKPELMWPLDCSDDANMQNDESEALLPCELVLDLGQCRKPIM